MVKSVWCTCRRPGFSSFHTHDSSRPSVNYSSRGSDTLFCAPWNYTNVLHGYTRRPDTQMHRMEVDKSERSRSLVVLGHGSVTEVLAVKV